VSDLAQAREEAWGVLASSPIRRAILGRDRCDRLVRIAHDVISDEELSIAAFENNYARQKRAGLYERVVECHSERCSGVFTTFILSWAISQIVQVLIRRWWRKVR
jgi:hypothetical protein